MRKKVFGVLVCLVLGIAIGIPVGCNGSVWYDSVNASTPYDPQVERLKRIRADLKFDVPEGSEMCQAYWRVKKYEELHERYRHNDIEDVELASFIEMRANQEGQKAATRGYDEMVAGRPLGCQKLGETEDEPFLIEGFKSVLDKYDPNPPGERFKSSVVKEAYRRAASLKASKALSDFRLRPDDDDAKGRLLSIIDNAKSWELSVLQLDIPLSAIVALEK